MPRKMLIRAGFFLLCSLLAPIAQAETRAAFLVGNGAYEFSAPLATPERDVELLAGVLNDLGFATYEHVNLTRREMASALSDFLRETKDADVLLFYFSGLGVQFDGTNYLLGIDGQLETELDVEAEALALDRVTQMLERNSRALLVLVDASRANPLADQFYTRTHSEARPDLARGLARVEAAPDGSLIAFSAAPGQVADDGELNSRFAEALARHLPTQGIDILSVMNRVAIEVQAASGDRQTPVVENALLQELYLDLGSGEDANAIARAQQEAMFQAALAMDSLRAWHLFSNRFPDGFFSDMANVELNRLQTRAMVKEAGLAIADPDEFDPSDIPTRVAQEMERALGVSAEEARQAQTYLNELGYDAGTVDGVIGPRTRTAIAAFQANLGLPSSGVMTAATAAALGLDLAGAEMSAMPNHSARIARRYDVDQVRLVESDARLLHALAALKEYELTYGFFEDRVYLAVNVWTQLGWDQAVALAQSAGGHLVTLTSAAENSFVFDLVRHDERFWAFWDDPESTAGATGPTIGLVQQEGAREPDGGWAWVTNEDLGFTSWRPGQPNNHNGSDFVATYMVMADEGPDRQTLAWAPNWADQSVLSGSLVIEIE